MGGHESCQCDLWFSSGKGARHASHVDMRKTRWNKRKTDGAGPRVRLV